MEDERQGINIDPNGINKGSSESTCSKSSNNNHNNNNNNNNNITNNNNVTINGKEQDRFLPIANVGRIMKKVIPDNGKISKDAKETVQECVSEFISFITGEASDKCQREKRKTINGDDIIWAITTLGFEEYVAPLKIYLNKYRDLEGEKLNLPKQQQQQQHRTGSDHHHHQKQNNSYNSNVYSSASSNLLPQPSFVSTDHQNFPFQFHQNSIQPQISPHDQIDSVGHW